MKEVGFLDAYLGWLNGKLTEAIHEALFEGFRGCSDRLTREDLAMLLHVDVSSVTRWRGSGSGDTIKLKSAVRIVLLLTVLRLTVMRYLLSRGRDEVLTFVFVFLEFVSPVITRALVNGVRMLMDGATNNRISRFYGGLEYSKVAERFGKSELESIMLDTFLSILVATLFARLIDEDSPALDLEHVRHLLGFE